MKNVAAARAGGRERAARSSAPADHGGAGEVRIIGGRWKRSRLPVPDRPGLRPTPDRVRETLFNWLGQDLSGWRCVDAFAGSGALGFEAASRGAAEVLLCERDAVLAANLEAACRRLGASAVRVEHGDGVAALRAMQPGSVDLVFLDPPFDSDLHAAALQAASAAIDAHGFVYLESAAARPQSRLGAVGLALFRHLRAGSVHAQLLARAPHA